MSAINVKSNDMFGPLGSAEKNKQWQRELLMERLRTHSAQNKTFAELSKAMRMSMLEKRYSLDPTERSNLQKCLDSMQHCIKVTTRQGLIERLESLSRQLGLKFMEDTSILFISSDMFYLEIVLDAAGTLSDVKVHHECKINQPQSCSELVTCLLKGDFADFTMQLEGLSSIYQLEAEPKLKSKAFVALEAMEMDLYSLYAAQNFHKDTNVILLESSVGIVQKRRGGHAMKLIYFVSPYDLLNLESKSLTPLSIDVVSTKNVGLSVTVNLEASNPNQLQILPTITLNSDGQTASIPSFSPITPANSIILPATFVLRLNKPLPASDRLIEAITSTTQQNFGDPSDRSSILELVVQTASNGEMKSGTKGLFVTLPDQNHCYFFSENKQLKGSVLKSIPYTEPSHVPKILTLLRQQALFHTLLASCVRPESKMGDLESTTMLEVSAIDINQISVALEHPFEESMATIEFDLKDVSNINCRIYSLTNNYDVVAIKLTKIIQKTLSIPITIRALLKFWDQEQMKGFHRGGSGIDNGNFSLPLGPNDPGGRMSDYRDLKPKTERNVNGNFGASNRQFFHGSAVMTGESLDFSSDEMCNFRSHETSVMSQFARKPANDSSFLNVKDNIGREDFYKCPKSKTDMAMNQISSETSDSSSLGTSTPTSDSGVANNPNLRRESNLDSDSNSTFLDGESSRNSMNDALAEASHKTSPKVERTEDWRQKNTSIDSKVSILPVKTPGLEFNSVLSGMGLERRPGIEIIPITASTAQSLPTSITITPITSSSKSERKSGSSRKYDEKSRSDKKRKRRKEGSPSMGPPDKMPSKQEGANRSLSVSVKTTDGASVTSAEMMKKISSSGSKLSSGSASKLSPKNSPSHISPKHLSSGTHSPKGYFNTSSPKHSSGSSGKPSMSALKSATTSSPKNEKNCSKSSFREKDRDRERERERGNKGNSLGLAQSSGSSSPKLKSSTVKLKQIDLSAALLPSTDHFTFDEATESDVSIVPGAVGGVGGFGKLGMPCAGSSSLANKVRKGSLSAVIDKLKSAQHVGEDVVNTGHSPGEASSTREKATAGVVSNKTIYNTHLNNAVKSISSGLNTSSTLTLPSPQNSEYMIKPSLDGMKITINKTRTKDSPSSNHSLNHSKSGMNSSSSTSSSFSKLFSSSVGGSGLGSPKRHTGLKPGVNSGPASKKSQSSQQFLKTSSSSPSSYANTQGRGNFQKSSSSGALSASSSSKSSFPYASSKSQSSSSLSTSIDVSKKDKAKNRTDASDVMKMLGFASPMDGFMKSLNTKFQIPKLSARTSDDVKKAEPSKTIASNPPVATTSVTLPPVTSPTLPNYASSSLTTAALPVMQPSKTGNPLSSAGVASPFEISKAISDFSLKNVPEKYAFSISKLPAETAPLPGNCSAISAMNKVSNIFAINQSTPKHTQGAPIGEPDIASSFGSLVNSVGTKEILRKTIQPATSVPACVPTSNHTSPTNFPPAMSVIGKSNCRIPTPLVDVADAAVCSAVSRESDEVVMRPPSVPCSSVSIDASRAATPNEIEPSSKLESNANNQSNLCQSRPLASDIGALSAELQNIINPSVARKLSSNPLVSQHKGGFPASPSVSLHIVKSPAPSPLMILPSPHSNSPCITDDELMDEALVGLTGK